MMRCLRKRNRSNRPVPSSTARVSPTVVMRVCLVFLFLGSALSFERDTVWIWGEEESVWGIGRLGISIDVEVHLLNIDYLGILVNNYAWVLLWLE
jgi:hypothetical protein